MMNILFSVCLYFYNSRYETAICVTQKDSNKFEKLEVKAAKRSLILVLAFLICWLLYAIISLLQVSHNYEVIILPNVAFRPD